MRFFTAIANAWRDIKDGAAEGRHQAQLRRQAEAELKERVVFKEGMEQLIGAARLTLGDDRKAVIQRIDQTLRGNSHYEKSRDELMAMGARIDAADDGMKRLAAIKDVPTGERDLMAQALDAVMRGNPHYEMARVQVLSRGAIASGKAEGFPVPQPAQHQGESMSKSTKTIIALAILAASGIAAAAMPLPAANYVGTENRDGLVPIPVCAKADLRAGTRYIWSSDQAVRAALHAGSQKGCFERLGREGDLGYSQAGVTLVREGGSVYRVAINGKPAGQALRALTAPAETVRPGASK